MNTNQLEQITRAHAAAAGAPQGRHEVDGHDLVELLAGDVARVCAGVADKGGSLATTRTALTGHLDGDWCTLQERSFAAMLAGGCEKIAVANPDAPGDAIRLAFEWTGGAMR